MLVADIFPGASSSSPTALAELDGEVFFRANDGTDGAELWKSDGTPAGTDQVLDINPGAPSSGPRRLTKVGGELFFFARDASHGEELWRTDPVDGAVLVKDIHPGIGSSIGGPGSGPPIASFGGEAFFRATDGRLGRELWKSDGTDAGTVLVKDVCPGECPSSPLGYLEFDGALYFQATDPLIGDELWRTDGTEEGTELAVDVNDVPFPGAQGPIVVLDNSTLFFPGGDLASAFGNDELYKSDGTAAGTELVRDLTTSGGSFPDQLTIFNDEVYFTAIFNSGGISLGRELFRTDGTEDGTNLVRDINPQEESSSPRILGEADGALFFSADDGTDGRELWRTSGGGATLVEDINPGSGSSLSFTRAAELDGELYFAADDGSDGEELWKADRFGAELVEDIHPSGSSSPDRLITIGDEIFFYADDGKNGRELWKTDGTTTSLVKDINLGVDSSDTFSPTALAEFNGELYFSADDGMHGSELWKSDGTAEGTELVVDINPGVAGSDPFDVTVLGDILLLGANDGRIGHELWKSDGTEGGTELVKDINPGESWSDIVGVVEFDEELYFVARTPAEGQELWKTDGTEEGTVLVTDHFPGEESSFPFSLTVMGGGLYCSADDPEAGRELHKLVTSNPFIRGDANGNGDFFPLLDALYILDNGFNMGPELPCRDAGDADGDNTYFPLLDALAILSHGFQDGPPPPAPHPDCGTDAEGDEDGITCDEPADGCDP